MQPETIRIASFNGTSSVFVWVLWHQTGAQYSAGANTSAVVEVRKVSNEVPQLVPDSDFMQALHRNFMQALRRTSLFNRFRFQTPFPFELFYTPLDFYPFELFFVKNTIPLDKTAISAGKFHCVD